MSKSDPQRRFDARLPLRFLLSWLFAALPLLLLCALLLSRFAVSSRSLAYCSAAIGFAAAAAAGASCAASFSGSRALAGLLAGAALTVLLLAVGLLVRRAPLPRDGLLSLVSFTLSGALFGSVFFGGKRKRGKGAFRFAPGAKKAR